MAEVKYLKSSYRFLAVITVLITSLFSENLEDRNTASLIRYIKYYPLLPQFINPFTDFDIEKPRSTFSKTKNNTIFLENQHPLWDGRFKNNPIIPYKDKKRKKYINSTYGPHLKKIKKSSQLGLIAGTIVFYNRYNQQDLQIPLVVNIDWYKDHALIFNSQKIFRDLTIKNIKEKKNINSTSGGIKLVNTRLGTDDFKVPVELLMRGNIAIEGGITSTNRDITETSQGQSNNTDFRIEQHQDFTIEGNIAERFYIDITQNSRNDFSWEDDMNIEYRGKEDDILKEVEFGNIRNLSLEGMGGINMGGENSSLFGIKAKHQIGPLALQSVVAREQSNKVQTPFTSGIEGEERIIRDYEFIKDRYFFIDQYYKDNYYPLNSETKVNLPDRKIENYAIFKFLTEFTNGAYRGTAYVDPLDSTSVDSLHGAWIQLEPHEYRLDPNYGWLRLPNASSNAYAIAYKTNLNESEEEESLFNGTHFFQCIETSCSGDTLKLKLIKDVPPSTSNSKTWHLMFKNVYSMGTYQISSEDEIEVSIEYDNQSVYESVSNITNESFLKIFGFDRTDPPDQIDYYGYKNAFIDPEFGELFFPNYLPFSYNSEVGTYDEALEGLLGSINTSENCGSSDNPCGPAMYFNTSNENNIIDESNFRIIITHISQSPVIKLNSMMMVEGSEVVKLGSEPLIRDVDYHIDYFQGEIKLINPDVAIDGQSINVTYEEHQLFSFDQKILLGTYAQYKNESTSINGGLFYYKQSIAEEKIDIGYEPMTNKAWNLSAQNNGEVNFLTNAVNKLPFIKATKPSKYKLDASYAQIFPDPNPLGQAFLDDFESSKRLTSFNINYKQWKISSPSLNEGENYNIIESKYNRGNMFWYNPYYKVSTEDIWPDLATSNKANNTETTTLNITTNFDRDTTLWNGIITDLYLSEFDQTESKYFDMWINSGSIDDGINYKLFIELGAISEDHNQNGKLDTEDQISNTVNNAGDGNLDDDEDIGIDNCIDDYEDGWGGCLCEVNECNDNQTLTYQALADSLNNDSLGCNYINDNVQSKRDLSRSDIVMKITKEICTDKLVCIWDEITESCYEKVNRYIPDSADPNSDNFYYQKDDCNEGSNKCYEKINGTEKNANAGTVIVPDTEDVNKNNVFEHTNEYFSIEIDPTKNDSTFHITGPHAGWKLLRIPLSGFKSANNGDWTNIRFLRLRVNHMGGLGEQTLKIAKLELVRNEWKELGVVNKNTLHDLEISEQDRLNTFQVEVINTDESSKYKAALKEGQANGNINIVQEYDEQNEISIKEQSLSLSFIKNDNNEENSGLPSEHVALIEAQYMHTGSEAEKSIFIYNNMEMYVYGGDPEDSKTGCWYDTEEACDTSKVELLFQFGSDENDHYYQIRQPIYNAWDTRNHIKINIDELNQQKIPIMQTNVEEKYDLGSDDCSDDFENGRGGCLCEDYNYEDRECLDDSFKNYQEIYKEYTELPELCNSGSNDEPECDINYCIWDEDNNSCNKKIDSINCENNSCNWDAINDDDFWENIDPNGDNYSEENNGITATENNNEHDTGENSIAAYDSETNIYSWTTGIEKVCHQCRQLSIKGEPAINNIKSIVIGIVNNSEKTIYSKVLVNELRMTGVKKSNGTSYSISGEINFSDLLKLRGNFSKKDENFHYLQNRMSSNNSERDYDFKIELFPEYNILLPRNWQIKTPITFSYTNDIKTPKYYVTPGFTDILVDQNDESSNLETIQDREEKVIFYTAFRKNSKSSNWFIKRTLDNISLSYQFIGRNISTDQIQKETINHYNYKAGYNYGWGKENFITPFEFMKDWILLGSLLGESRYFYTPQDLEVQMEFNEKNNKEIQRKTEKVFGDTIGTYFLNRTLKLDHDYTKTLTGSYNWSATSDLRKLINNKSKIVKELDPGLVQKRNETLRHTLKPDFLDWLNPEINFRSDYKWELKSTPEPETSSNASDVFTKNTLKSNFKINIKNIMELIYTPDNKGSSKKKNRSRGRGSSSRSSKKKNKINIQNKNARKILGKIYSIVEKFPQISTNYTYETTHDYDQIPASVEPTHFFRYGINRRPEKLSTLISIEENAVSAKETFLNQLSMSTTISLDKIINIDLLKNVSTSFDFERMEKLTLPSLENNSNAILHNNISYFPIGAKGTKGMPMPKWSITVSKLAEKIRFIEDYFQTFTLSHVFQGNREQSYTNNIKEDETFLISYSPLLKVKAKTHGRSPIIFDTQYDFKQKIINKNSTQRDHNHTITSSIKFNKKGGLKIPLFFLRDFYIDNDMDYAINFSYIIEKKLEVSDVDVDTIIDDITFNEKEKNITWSLRNSIGYRFNQWVTGNIYFDYSVSEQLRTPKTVVTDFGFNMKIRITG